ncbi:MAG: hypothetical protein K5686_00310 [Lachnospiraceae bacterium]|nr:hypothetical protein [Lachnospiraceae bacterium]
MNEYDLLDAIGGIDPEYIKAAGTAVKKAKKRVPFRYFTLAAAGLVLMVVAGVVLRNTRPVPEEYTDGSGVLTTDGAMPPETDGLGVSEGITETDGTVDHGIEKSDGSSAAKEAEETEEAVAAESADYPAMLMYEGALYKDSGEEFIGEVTEDGALRVSSYTDGEPKENGQQNFDRSCEVRFFVLNDETIAVRVEQTWKLFTKR